MKIKPHNRNSQIGKEKENRKENPQQIYLMLYIALTQACNKLGVQYWR